PDRLGAPPSGGRAGSSRALIRIIRPRLVTSPTSPRAVVRTAAMTASCLARGPSDGIGSALEVRASSPVDDRRTKQGSSLTSRGAAVLTGFPADSRRTVRRGVPYFLATSASSLETVR